MWIDSFASPISSCWWCLLEFVETTQTFSSSPDMDEAPCHDVTPPSLKACSLSTIAACRLRVLLEIFICSDWESRVVFQVMYAQLLGVMYIACIVQARCVITIWLKQKNTGNFFGLMMKSYHAPTGFPLQSSSAAWAFTSSTLRQHYSRSPSRDFNID